MTVPLRATAPGDAALLAVLHREWDEPWDEHAFATLLTTPGVFGLLAGDDRPLGFVLCRIAADEGEVLTLFVPASERRRGVATALLARLLTELPAAGAASLFLEVAESNGPARGLYRGFGFSEVGRRRRYYKDGSDALVMRKALGPG